MRTALIIGNTDGIGLALTKLLLQEGYYVVGVSRRESKNSLGRNYAHHVLDAADAHFADELRGIVAAIGELALCVYCVGVGETLELDNLGTQVPMLRANLCGAVAATEAVIPRFLNSGSGHFIGLSSQGDTLLDAAGAGYAASKAGLTAYLEGLALLCRARKVAVTNVRFGFVDTKMAKAGVRPFTISPQKAAQHIYACVHTRPVRSTYPKRLAPLLWVLRLRMLFSLC